jgi:hypothetical protein
MTIANPARPLEAFIDQAQPSPAGAEPLGRVVSVGGSQLVVQFPTDTAAARDEQTDVTVGTFIGIWNGRSLVVGALCDISLDKDTDGRPNGPTTGRVDLLGELVCDESGAGYFQRGVMAYPKIGNAVVPVGNRELRIIFDAAGPSTIDIGHLQQDSSILP